MSKITKRRHHNKIKICPKEILHRMCREYPRFKEQIKMAEKYLSDADANKAMTIDELKKLFDEMWPNFKLPFIFKQTIYNRMLKCIK